jgi:hypothetical protein
MQVLELLFSLIVIENFAFLISDFGFWQNFANTKWLMLRG